MMKKIAFYGKGGIGKSTTASNVSAALSLAGKSVCQIGCDPKNDSTRLLLGGNCRSTVLDVVHEKEDEVEYDDVVHTGFNGIRCIEAGGPEPGVGCAGRGIIVALKTLEALDAIGNPDVILYDVLGDVVCGGFAVPIREGYAEEIYIVTSGEMMALYAANNIAKGISRFANRGKVRLGGLIANSRNVHRERELIEAFAERLHTKLICFVPRDPMVQQAEIRRQTVLEYAPECEQAGVYRELAESIWNNESDCIPTPMGFDELEAMVYHYGSR